MAHDQEGVMRDLRSARIALLLGLAYQHQHIMIMIKHVTRRFMKKNDEVMLCMVWEIGTAWCMFLVT